MNDITRKEQQIVKKLINKGEFEKIYEYMLNAGCCFSYAGINVLFRKCDSKTKFLYLLYAIAKDPDVEKYETLLNVLIFEDPFLENYEVLVRKYALEAIEKFPDAIEIKELILFMYDDSPSDLFSKEELDALRIKNNETRELAVYLKARNDSTYRGFDRSDWIPMRDANNKMVWKWFEEYCQFFNRPLPTLSIENTFAKRKPFYIKFKSVDKTCDLILCSQKEITEFCGCEIHFLGIDVVYDEDHSLCADMKDNLLPSIGANGLCETLDKFIIAKDIASKELDANKIMPLYTYEINLI